jgi:hypothetical protein
MCDPSKILRDPTNVWLRLVFDGSRDHLVHDGASTAAILHEPSDDWTRRKAVFSLWAGEQVAGQRARGS